MKPGSCRFSGASQPCRDVGSGSSERLKSEPTSALPHDGKEPEADMSGMPSARMQDIIRCYRPEHHPAPQPGMRTLDALAASFGALMTELRTDRTEAHAEVLIAINRSRLGRPDRLFAGSPRISPERALTASILAQNRSCHSPHPFPECQMRTEHTRAPTAWDHACFPLKMTDRSVLFVRGCLEAARSVNPPRNPR